MCAAAVKEKGMFGVPIFGVGGKSPELRHDQDHDEEDRKELAAWLTDLGYAKFATKEWLDKFDEELAYDSIEDMTYLMDDDEFTEVGMDREDAVKIEAAAKRHIMNQFLVTVPVLQGSKENLYTNLVEKLLAAGYDEPDDVADMEEDEFGKFELTPKEAQHLIDQAEQYDARELLTTFLSTYRDETNEQIFRPKDVMQPMLEDLLAAGVEGFSDIVKLTKADLKVISEKDLAKLQSDPRVLAHSRKQEL